MDYGPVLRNVSELDGCSVVAHAALVGAAPLSSNLVPRQIPFTRCLAMRLIGCAAKFALSSYTEGSPVRTMTTRASRSHKNYSAFGMVWTIVDYYCSLLGSL